MAHLITVSSTAIDTSRNGDYRIAIRICISAGASADFKPGTLCQEISKWIRETTIFDRRTSPECVVRFSSETVAFPLNCVGAASAVKRIAHSVIKIVVSLYILTIKENVKCLKTGTSGGWCFTV